MSELLQNPPIMTVGEFRNLTGNATLHMSDEEIQEHIAELDILAQLFVAKKKAEVSPMKHE